jgi:hypothetical protein
LARALCGEVACSGETVEAFTSVGNGETLMTPAFRVQMQRMKGLRFMPDDLGTHWEGLSDLDQKLLENAVSLAIKECVDFPTPAELRAMSERISPRVTHDNHNPERQTDLEQPRYFNFPGVGRLKITRHWAYYCETCHDTGFESFYCSGDQVYAGVFPCTKAPWWDEARCSNAKEHPAHEWTQHCGCWFTNPDLKRKRDYQAQQAAHRTSKQDRS